MLLFNFPLLLIWDQGGTVFGLPSLPVALFVIWAGLIALLAWVSERGPAPPLDRDILPTAAPTAAFRDPAADRAIDTASGFGAVTPAAPLPQPDRGGDQGAGSDQESDRGVGP